MNFREALESSLNQYAGFSGRASRSEYWWFFVFNLVVTVVVSVISAAISFPVLGLVATVALILPGLAVAVRRLHDTSRSAWWLLVGVIPLIGAIILIVFFCLDGTPNENQFGPSPRRAPPEYGGGGAQWAPGI